MEAGSIKDEEDENESDSSTPPTGPASFQGRLNLANFAFSPGLKTLKRESTPQSPTRRSPRIPAPDSPLPTPLSKRPFPSPKPFSSPRKRSRTPSGYAPPSTYAHLPPLRDVLAPSLICVFIGLNPGIQTATSGHAYAHPSNLFWKLLHSSGCTTRRCRPEEDGDLPRLFELGNTNIVERPTRNGSELSKSEMDASVGVLEAKIARWRPEAVCVVGKSIWESLWRVRKGKRLGKSEFSYGWQEGERMGAVAEDENEESWEGARIFVASSTSGLAASLLPAEKERIWRELGIWVEQRRKERGELMVKEET